MEEKENIFSIVWRPHKDMLYHPDSILVLSSKIKTLSQLQLL